MCKNLSLDTFICVGAVFSALNSRSSYGRLESLLWLPNPHIISLALLSTNVGASHYLGLKGLCCLVMYVHGQGQIFRYFWFSEQDIMAFNLFIFHPSFEL